MPVINLSNRPKRAIHQNSSPEPESDPLREKRPRHNAADSNSPLCAECQILEPKLDDHFDEAFETFNRLVRDENKRLDIPTKVADGRIYYDAIAIHSFNDRLRGDATCPLCQFFRSMRVQPDQHERYKLIALPSSESWLFRSDGLKASNVWDDVVDSVFMAVVPDLDWLPPGAHEHTWIERWFPAVGVVYRLQLIEPPGPRYGLLVKPRELAGSVNMAFVRGCLTMCREKHGAACRTRTSQDVVERGFRLIDCEADSPNVEAHKWGTAYAALSYVWGTSTEDQVEWPKTVLDAVSATKAVGLRYLWVDRLCINQSDLDEKAYLISKMATIYESSEVTLVAAGGNGASHGLPGVASTHRNSQPRYTLNGGNTIISTLRDPRHDLLESSYWTRGWTYQEGILSNRRVVFTENQVYWECRNMAAQESIATAFFHRPSRIDPDTDDSSGPAEEGSAEREGRERVMADFMLTGVFKSDAYSGGSGSNQQGLHISEDDPYRLDYGFPPHLQATLRAQLRGLNEHVRAYSSRRLTNHTDALPAFMGITSMYQTSPGLYLLQGLPLWLQGNVRSYSATQITFAISVCDWYHRRSIQAHQMFISEPCTRRSHLPSWSWAGWDGPVSWRAPPQIEHCEVVADLIDSIAEGQPRRPLWAADIRLCNSAPLRSHANMPNRTVELRNCHSRDVLDAEQPDAIVLQNPYLLCYFKRSEDLKRQWRWFSPVGRLGRAADISERQTWDEKQYRIAGRLSFISLSVDMTEEQWTEDHYNGNLISVLMFAMRWDPEKERGHGGAHFMTLRKVRDLTVGASCWERIGVVYLVIPKESLDECVVDDLLVVPKGKRKTGIVPVERREMVVVIQ